MATGDRAYGKLNSRNAHQGSHCGTCGDADHCFDNDYPCKLDPQCSGAYATARYDFFVVLQCCSQLVATFGSPLRYWDHARPFCGRLWNPRLVKCELSGLRVHAYQLLADSVIDCFKKWLEKCAAALRDHLIDNMGQSNLLLGILEDVLGTC